MFVVLSTFFTVIVFFALSYLVIKKPYLLVKPSTLFLVFFFLQVQLSSAINSGKIADQLENPWIYFLLIHAFSVICLFIVFFFQRRTAKKIFAHLGYTGPILSVTILSRIAILLLIVDYIIVVFYLSVVPFYKTGFYAAFFKPEMLDSYRQLSFTLISDPILRYSFTILTKILAPITGAVCLVLAIIAWKRNLYLISILSWCGLFLSIWPAMLYGARGPGAMVALAAAFAWFLVFKRKLNLMMIIAAFVLVFTPPVIIQMAKSSEFSVDNLLFQSVNMLDRAFGRGYIDNIWHLLYVQERGFSGVSAIEKIAPLFGAEPVDSFNDVSKVYASNSVRCDKKIDENCQAVLGTGSAGASFVIMNYTMFGVLSLLLSLAFVFFIDLLLWLYSRISDFTLFAAISASIIPALSLSFSLFTTVLASKGLLLIPLTCLLIGIVMNRLYHVRSYSC